jgi:hypothetical protein
MPFARLVHAVVLTDGWHDWHPDALSAPLE